MYTRAIKIKYIDIHVNHVCKRRTYYVVQTTPIIWNRKSSIPSLENEVFQVKLWEGISLKYRIQTQVSTKTNQLALKYKMSNSAKTRT